MKGAVCCFRVVLVLMCGVATQWAGAEPVPTELIAERWHGDEVLAVLDAGDRYLAKSRREDREYFGAIFADDAGRHWLTVGRGAAGHDKFTMAVRTPTGMRLRAFWHTHGRGSSEREYFSGPDAKLVRTTGRPLYLITPRGKVRLLKPDSRTHAAHPSRLRSTVGLKVAFAGETIADLDRRVRRT